jgi:DNA-binding LytR/AlgR family response regulator
MELIIEKKIKPIIIKIPEGFEYFDYEEIIQFEAQGNCSLVYSTRSQKPTKSICNLVSIEKRYPYNSFLRCHKSHIINLLHVKKIHIKTHQVFMEGNIIVPISQQCLKCFKKLSNLG